MSHQQRAESKNDRQELFKTSGEGWGSIEDKEEDQR
jgi:hypothetical protein